MITGALIALGLGVAGALFGVLPAASTLNLPDLSGWILGYAWLNSFLPIDAAMAAGAMILAVYGAIFVMRLAITAWSQVPIIGGGG